MKEDQRSETSEGICGGSVSYTALVKMTDHILAMLITRHGMILAKVAVAIDKSTSAVERTNACVL